MQRLAAIVGIFSLVSACAGEPEVYAVVQDRAYTPSVFRLATAGKVVRTVVAGNPFKAPQEAVDRAVLAAMQPENWGFTQPFTPRTTFATDTDGAAGNRFHIAVVIGPGDADDLADFCRLDRPLPLAGGAAPPAIARMVFCDAGTPLSTTRGEIADVASPNDPRFGELITRMTMALFPQRREDGDCRTTLRRGNC